MSAISAVVFDMDGVLIDSREFIYRAMEDTLATNGVDVTRAQLAAVTGKPIQGMYAALVPHLDAGMLEKAHLEHHSRNMHLVAVYDGVEDVLGALQKQGTKIGLFTGFDKQTYDRLTKFDLTDYFDSIIESTRYKKHKPDPEGLELCMRELGVEREQTVYVGDGISDMMAGKSAGVRAVVGITHGFGSRESLEAAGADFIINSMSELPAVLAKVQAVT